MFGTGPVFNVLCHDFVKVDQRQVLQFLKLSIPGPVTVHSFLTTVFSFLKEVVVITCSTGYDINKSQELDRL